MKISIVIATYNGGKYILDQLNSIKDQTLMPDEVLIFDDRSTDNTSELVKKFVSNNELTNWKLKINKENLGYKENFFNLLKAASGDLIFLSDQDDVWSLQKVEKMVKIMQEEPTLRTLNSAIQLIDQNSQPIKLVAKPNFYNANFLYSKKPLKQITFFKTEDIIKRNISPGCSMCLTKQIRDEFVSVYQGELPHDWFLNLLASSTDGCGFFNEPLVNYRMHSQNTLGVTVDPGALGKVKKFESARQNKIKEFTGLIAAFDNISAHVKINGGKHLTNYLHARLDFYEHQNLKSLIKLRRFPEYHQTATFKGRLWDIIISLHLKDVFYKVAELKK